jgi:hypothetical protein
VAVPSAGGRAALEYGTSEEDPALGHRATEVGLAAEDRAAGIRAALETRVAEVGVHEFATGEILVVERHEIFGRHAGTLERHQGRGQGPWRKALTPAPKGPGYAQVEIPHCLLVDRDPRCAQAIRFSHPDRAPGACTHIGSWEFGKDIRPPEPFCVAIPTGEWQPWSRATGPA